MDLLDDYMRVTRVPRHMQKSVRSYFDFIHESDLDHALDPSAVLGALPESISSRIRVATNIKAIEGVELFETFLSPTCRIMLAARLHTRIGIPGEYLYVQVGTGAHHQSLLLALFLKIIISTSSFPSLWLFRATRLVRCSL